MSRDDVAGKMAERGHTTWNRSTVRSVELGKRQIKLTEGAALDAILGTRLLGTAADMSGDGGAEFIRSEVRGVHAQLQDLQTAADAITQTRDDLDSLEYEDPDAAAPGVAKWIDENVTGQYVVNLAGRHIETEFVRWLYSVSPELAYAADASTAFIIGTAHGAASDE
ncbi:hypothetical protein PSRA_1267 [Pseudoscardovia radai]|uniref:Uncharacterized protein n=1 Tax=Pseudoscardovia radai TaxID=987066 RepID=A0A261EWK4_9BIFI|nr:hypothetical protein [Pseudoscardovia radai]OZG51225.1 hypothetical protein PSRA_1267 [Pseudoscardovia radai]